MPLDTIAAPSDLDIRVYYEDTDTGGVVYYANYLKFFERGRTEWLRRLGVDQSDMARREHKVFVVKSVQIQYCRPARLDDLITVSSSVTRVGPASINFAQIALCDGELLCKSAIQVCCVDQDTFRPAPFSRELRALLKEVHN